MHINKKPERRCRFYKEYVITFYDTLYFSFFFPFVTPLQSSKYSTSESLCYTPMANWMTLQTLQLLDIKTTFSIILSYISSNFVFVNFLLFSDRMSVIVFCPGFIVCDVRCHVHDNLKLVINITTVQYGVINSLCWSSSSGHLYHISQC